MATVKDLVKAFKKDYGDEVAITSSDIPDGIRVPTGIFTLDLSMGGGFAKGKMSIVFGPESSNKTNVCLKTIAEHQRLWEDEVCAFVDLEASYDPKWAESLGVNTENLLLLQPDYAEEVADMVEALMHTDDIGLIVLDSLAAMMTANEGESSIEKQAVGGAAGILSRFFKKTTKAQRLARREGRTPTLICISQTRNKIGVMYGNPEVFSGGNAPKFYANAILRFYGKDIVERDVNPDVPCRKETKVVIKKHKLPITGTTCAFEMAVIPHKGLKVGSCHDMPPILAHLKQFGWLSKVEGSKGWQLFGEEYPTQKACMDAVYDSPENLDKVKGAITTEVMKRAVLGDTNDD